MFGNKILDFKDELLKDLNTLLSFESVDGEKNDECDNALNFILKRAEDFGLTGERTTDKSGHITLGDSGKLCGVSHRNVVFVAVNIKTVLRSEIFPTRHSCVAVFVNE